MLKQILDYALPQRCVLCGQAGSEICTACTLDLHLNLSACPRCAIMQPQALNGHACGACLKRSPRFEQAFSAWVYDYPIDSLLRRFKFGRELAIGRLLADTLAERVQLSATTLPEVLIPVPLSPQRFQERGFNQACEIARRLSAKLDRQMLTDRLKRVRHTAPQAELGRAARRRNVRGAFAWNGARAPKHVSLIDDVMTTGATLNACAQTLLEAGAKRVDVWVLARA